MGKPNRRFYYQGKTTGIPSVLISNYVNGFTSILIDNIGGSCQAVEFDKVRAQKDFFD